jgi:hypothetical protein
MKKEFKLYLSNNISEQLFFKKYGKDVYNQIKQRAFIESRGCCAACRHEPPEDKKATALSLHIPNNKINKINPELTEGVILCKACHATQHIEASIINNWVVLVNSMYSQKNIIRLTRANQVHGALTQRTIIKLKKTPQQFLEELRGGSAKFSTTLKVIFTNSFVLDDL